MCPSFFHFSQGGGRIKEQLIKMLEVRNSYGEEVKEEKVVYACENCLDSGFVEIHGGSDYDDWGVVDVKTCYCQKDND